jgi:hypothetical protein
MDDMPILTQFAHAAKVKKQHAKDPDDNQWFLVAKKLSKLFAPVVRKSRSNVMKELKPLKKFVPASALNDMATRLIYAAVMCSLGAEPQAKQEVSNLLQLRPDGLQSNTAASEGDEEDEEEEEQQ